MDSLVVSEHSQSAKPCHNCRRQRLKCDRSLPHCNKCVGRGQECLGYQRHFRWQQGVASRGKMTGLTFGQTAARRRKPANMNPLPVVFLADPLLQDLPLLGQSYLKYFASDVCKDLVLYDAPKQNRFRELIPLTQGYPLLLWTITAISALHMGNARNRPTTQGSTALSPHYGSRRLYLKKFASPALSQNKCYVDALQAKQRALCLLKASIDNIGSPDVDVVLATILLLIELDLVDNGRDTWKHHVHGARTIIRRLLDTQPSWHTPMTPLRRCFISNCVVFDILGSTLATAHTPTIETLSNEMLSLLQDAEGNHCSSFPTTLLLLLHSGARIAQSSRPPFVRDGTPTTATTEAMSLLRIAQDFDPVTWARQLQSSSPTADLAHRTHVASAHQAAVDIYLTRLILHLDPSANVGQDLDDLVASIVCRVSQLHPQDALFTAVTWPAFIAGAETDDPRTQDWVRGIFGQIWEIQPWGNVKGALSVLEQIWSKHKAHDVKTVESEIRGANEAGSDWIAELRSEGVDWLIV